jgi:hypothetical protein
MSKMSRYFVIKDIKITDPYAMITVEIYYEEHMWRRVIRVDLDNVKRFTYQELQTEVKKQAAVLIAKRAPIENNLLRLYKMRGEKRQL